MIFDEVKIGSRAFLGGYQGMCGIRCDVSTFGKALASGFPIATVAGKREYMDLAISDNSLKRVLIAGTYNCHAVPLAAPIARLKN